MYVYIYIYMCVCVCVCVCHMSCKHMTTEVLIKKLTLRGTSRISQQVSSKWNNDAVGGRCSGTDALRFVVSDSKSMLQMQWATSDSPRMSIRDSTSVALFGQITPIVSPGSYDQPQF
jgi:hypothetical protein